MDNKKTPRITTMNYTYEFTTIPNLETKVFTSVAYTPEVKVVIEKETGYYLKLRKKYDSTAVFDWEKWKAEERIRYWITTNHPEFLL